jgi:hypothetical protein
MAPRLPQYTVHNYSRIPYYANRELIIFAAEYLLANIYLV